VVAVETIAVVISGGRAPLRGVQKDRHGCVAARWITFPVQEVRRLPLSGTDRKKGKCP